MIAAGKRLRGGRKCVRALCAHPENTLLNGLFLRRPGIGSPLISPVVRGGGR